MNEPKPAFFSAIPHPADLGTGPVPAHYYTDPDWYELKRKAIFMRSWIEIGHVCELAEPNSFIVRTLDFAKASILITRGKDGKVRAFHNACTHRGTQLTQDAQGKRALFTCPYHGWTFDHEGDLRAAPDFERFYIEDKKSCALKPVAADVCAGLIFVNLDPSPAQGLREYLGEEIATKLEKLPVATATTFSEYVYDIDANWKITYDNFQEQYHIRFIHPRSGGPACGEDNPFGYPTEFCFYGPHRTERIWQHPAPQIPPVQGFSMGMAGKFIMEDGIVPTAENENYFGLFPNFFLLGSAAIHFSHVVTPISAGKSRGVIRIYWNGEDRSASQRYTREFLTQSALDIHSEDIAVIEAGQRGLESGALTHIHFQTQELLCRHLMEEIVRRVDAYRLEQSLEGAVA